VPGRDVILCINSGSSSLKFALFSVTDGPPKLLASGAVEGIGRDGGRARLDVAAAHATPEPREHPGHHRDHAFALETAFSLLEDARLPAVTLVGHRVVHGGAHYTAPVRVDETVVENLKAITPLAPLHQPAAIAGIVAVTSRLPGVPQVACFDTAFHASLPEVARRLPLPARFEGVRRYGFHGLSYEHVMAELGPAPPSRVVIAHLGAGSSLVAVKNGKAVDTTMGLTPAGGIPMATRSGDLDPGVLVHLLRHGVPSVDALEALLERESGLLAIGGTADMKLLLERAPTDERAALAVSMFSNGVKKAIGAFVAALGGIDLLVFTGGIGERAAVVRRLACDGLGVFGIELDFKRNFSCAPLISPDAGRCAVRLVAANEELVIARHVVSLVRARSG
jgi:acetate kinase